MGSLCFVKIGSIWLVGKSMGTRKTRKVFKFNEIWGVCHFKRIDFTEYSANIMLT
jgi:hypothetical protein